MRSGLVHLLLIDEDLSHYAQWSHWVEQLAPQGYQLSWCSNLADAKRCLLSGVYDLVFIDNYRDPQLTRRILNNAWGEGAQSPVVVICQPGDGEARDKALAAGAIDYLYRGEISSPLLERVLRYVLGGGVAEAKTSRYTSHYSNYDPLTGLPNRFLFLDRLSQAVQRAGRDKENLALFYLDLDQFKKVNDSFGHEAGDQLLELISERLQSCLQKGATLARLGGDEFAILLDEMDSTSDILHQATRLTDELAHPFLLADHQVHVGASIGIAVYPEAGQEVDTLLRNAHLAKDQAKTTPGTSFRFYNQQMNEEAQSQLYREADLRRGLRREEFCLFYQPRVALDSGRIVGMEALIRWQHPVRGLVKPAEFIALAEDVGLIQPLGYWVVHQACADVKRMDALGLPELDVAINLSFKQFEDPRFAETVANIMAESGVAAGRIEFELTETTIMGNADATTSCMRSLSRLGSTFSLDDFGTGYSSFAHIQRLPISALKIDRSFIENVTRNDDDACIVRAIVSLAHSLKMVVVAEGAETVEHMRFLKSLACDQVQGFYFSPPVAFEVICAMIGDDVRLAV